MKIAIGDMNARFGNIPIETAKNEFKRINVDKKEPNKQGKMMVKFCESTGIIPLNGLKLKGRKKPLKDNWTFERSNGRSTIDYIMVHEDYVNEITNMEVEDEVWEHCNTPHRLVKAILEVNKYEKHEENAQIKAENKQKEDLEDKKKNNKKAINKIVNKKTWQEYKNKSEELPIFKNIEEIKEDDNEETNWTKVKKTFSILEELVREIEKKQEPIITEYKQCKKELKDELKTQKKKTKKLEKKDTKRERDPEKGRNDEEI